MLIHRLAGLAAAIFLALPLTTSAEPIRLFESGSPGLPGQTSGYLIGDFGFTGLRFFLPFSVVTESIGGHFAGHGELFGAIVALSGHSDLPDSHALDTPDVRGAARITLSSGDPVGSSVFSAPLHAALTPGWYALVFGSGLFGASGEGIFVFGNFPRTAQEILGSGGLTRADLGWGAGVLGTGRLYAFVDGRVASAQPAPIPEPSTLLLLGTGALALLRRRISAPRT